MACANESFSSFVFVDDLPSYGLIGLVSLGLVLYLTYIVLCVQNHLTSATSVYIYFSQISLLLLLLCPLTFLFRPSEPSLYILCSAQTLTLQILPFCLLLGFNVHLAAEWLFKVTKPTRNLFLIDISSFLLFFLAILIQTAILLVWFYNHDYYEQIIEPCTNECRRPLFLCSLIFYFILLMSYSLQSTVRYRQSRKLTDLVYLLTSVFALGVTVVSVGVYYSPSWKFATTSSLLAYGTLLLVYAFLGPSLFGELVHRRQTKAQPAKDHLDDSDRMSFKCLSLTKEQQRAYMAAYIKRNLTVSCENLTTKVISSSVHQYNPTRHSTLSVDSLCPTLVSTISRESPAAGLQADAHNESDTMKSEQAPLSALTDMKS